MHFTSRRRALLRSNTVRLVFIGALIVLFGVALWLRGMTVALMPIDWDENYYLNIGSNFIERGDLTPYMWRLDSDTNIIAGSGTGYGVLLLTAWLKYVDFSFTGGRILMFLIGVANMGAAYGLARAWWRSHVAGLVAALTAAALSSSFVTVYVRMDAPGVLAYTLVLWLHIVAVRQNKAWLHLLTGVAVIAAAEFHILATLYIGALAVYYAVDHVVKSWQARQWITITSAVWFGVGAFVAGVLYIVVHILPDPQAYFIIPQDCYYCEPASLMKEFERYQKYWSARPVEVAVGAVVMLLALARFRAEDRHYLLLLGGFMLTLAVVSPPTQPRYSAHGWIWIALGAGGVFTANTPEWAQFAERFYLREALVLAGVVALLLFQWGQFDGYRNPTTQLTLGEQRERVVNMDLPRDTVILGYAPYYEDFTDYPLFMSYNSGEKYGMELRGETYADLLRREQPDVLVIHVSSYDPLTAYAKRHDFVRVMEHLWVRPELCAAGYCS
jgi:hypothetical protein